MALAGIVAVLFVPFVVVAASVLAVVARTTRGPGSVATRPRPRDGSRSNLLVNRTRRWPACSRCWSGRRDRHGPAPEPHPGHRPRAGTGGGGAGLRGGAGVASSRGRDRAARCATSAHAPDHGPTSSPPGCGGSPRLGALTFVTLVACGLASDDRHLLTPHLRQWQRERRSVPPAGSSVSAARRDRRRRGLGRRRARPSSPPPAVTDADPEWDLALRRVSGAPAPARRAARPGRDRVRGAGRRGCGRARAWRGAAVDGSSARWRGLRRSPGSALLLLGAVVGCASPSPTVVLGLYRPSRRASGREQPLWNGGDVTLAARVDGHRSCRPETDP